MRVFLMILAWAALLPLGALGETPKYLIGELTLPEGALEGPPQRAEALGIPTEVWTPAGPQITGAEDEEELLAADAYLIVDGPYFLLTVQTASGRAILRGGETAVLIAGGSTDALTPPPPEFFDLLAELGLLPQGETIEMCEKDVPLKLPRPPAGSALDPVLWALVNHPDWIGFARDYGLERVGIRVRVVVEKEGQLPEAFEPYVQSSSDGMAELLVPIPLLPSLGEAAGVLSVRPPYIPHPAEG